MCHEHMRLTQLLLVVFLHLTWRLIFQCTMRTSCIVEFNVGINPFLEFRFRGIISPIKLFIFERREKRFGYCIIMWLF